MIAGNLREVRVDRVFRAGTAPHTNGDNCWWIIDYKTAKEGGNDAKELLKLRALFAPQLELYAKVLRNLHGNDAVIRAGTLLSAHGRVRLLGVIVRGSIQACSSFPLHFHGRCDSLPMKSQGRPWTRTGLISFAARWTS